MARVMRDVGTWCTDDALPKLNLTRARAFDITMVCASVYGLKIGHPQAMSGLEYLQSHEEAMKGPWNNDGFQISRDPRVRGHRHDQTVLSVAAHEFDLQVDRPPCLLDYAYNNGVYPEQAVAVKEGIL